MSGQYYLLDIDKRGVATVTLNRPKLHNAFNSEFITELIECFETLSDDSNVRLVVLTGAGRSFCAGADLNWMKSMKDYSDEENYQDSQNLAKLFETINCCPKPVIGIVNGAALGGGTGLVACCDYVLACRSARFGFTEVKLGLVPAVISPYVIAKIGESNARAYFLSGEIFEAAMALRKGLIHQEVPLDDLESSAKRVVGRFLKAAPTAAKEAKKLITDVVCLSKNNNKEQLNDYTCKLISRIRTSEEGQEGMQALLEKREPNWTK